MTPPVRHRCRRWCTSPTNWRAPSSPVASRTRRTAAWRTSSVSPSARGSSSPARRSSPVSDALAFVDDEPLPRLSAVRVTIAFVVLAAVAAAATFAVRHTLSTAPVRAKDTWFAPYVDATLTPLYSFQDPSANLARQVVLGFVVSAPGATCSPSWGAIGSLSAADQSVALSARLAQLAQEGAMAIVSFGGRANTDLSVACHDATSLAQAYQ